MKQAKQPHNILAMTDMNLDHSLCLTMSLDIAVSGEGRIRGKVKI